MINWIKSLFGRGRVRVEWTGLNQSGKSVSGNAKAPYVGTWDEDAMIRYVKQQLLYQHGVVTTQIQIVAHIED